jgi:hypothetical protein
VIKQRFEDESSVFKSYDDAIHDVRVDLYIEGIKAKKTETEDEAEETATKNDGNFARAMVFYLYTKDQSERKRY